MEKCLTATTFAGFKQNLQNIYPTKSTLIGNIVDKYYDDKYIDQIPN